MLIFLIIFWNSKFVGNKACRDLTRRNTDCKIHKPSSEYAHGGYHVMSIKTVDACWAILDALSAICNGKPHTEKWLQNLISL